MCVFMETMFKFHSYLQEDTGGKNTSTFLTLLKKRTCLYDQFLREAP